MEEKVKKLCGFIFAALVLVGLVLVIVGFVTPVVTAPDIGDDASMGLFHEGWAEFAEYSDAGVEGVPSRVFLLIAVIVTLVGCVALVVDAVLRLFLGKDLKIVRLVGAAVTLIGAVLILVAGLLLAGSFNDFLASMSPVKVEVDVYSAGVGVFLGFIGGLVAAVGGALPLLKAFN